MNYTPNAHDSIRMFSFRTYMRMYGWRPIVDWKPKISFGEDCILPLIPRARTRFEGWAYARVMKAKLNEIKSKRALLEC